MMDQKPSKRQRLYRPSQSQTATADTKMQKELDVRFFIDWRCQDLTPTEKTRLQQRFQQHSARLTTIAEKIYEEPLVLKNLLNEKQLWRLASESAMYFETYQLGHETNKSKLKNMVLNEDFKRALNGADIARLFQTDEIQNHYAPEVRETIQKYLAEAIRPINIDELCGTRPN